MASINITEHQIESASASNEKYKDLLRQLQEINNKYNLNYVDTTLDLPETLGLTKLTYEAPSAEQLKKQAEESILSNYLKSLQKIESTEQSGKDKVANSITTAENALQSSLEKLQAELATKENEAQNSAVKRGTARGSILDSVREAKRDDFEKEAQFAENVTASKIAVLFDQLGQIASEAQAAIDSLDKTRDADIETALTKLLKEVEAQKDSITKYNNAIEEKEQKYQASRENALLSAKQKEAARAQKAADLYYKLGQIGYEQQVTNEKLTLVRNFFDTMSKEEAMSILNSDSSLKAELGVYYNYIVDFVSKLN